MDAVTAVLQSIRDEQPAASARVLVGAVVLATALVWVPVCWVVTRHVVTLVHEGAHGLVAAASGRKLAGIRLHSDSSGVTVSAGRPTGAGMVATAAAGYLGPAVLGLGCAGLLASGHAVAVLWLLLLLLALLLLQIRNFFGLWSVLAVGVALFVVCWRLSDQSQLLVAHTVTWFLLIAAPRGVLELHRARRQQRTTHTDADQLAKLTYVPAVLWVGLFFLAGFAALLGAVDLLLLDGR